MVVRRRGEVALPTSLEPEYEGGKTETMPLLDDPKTGAPWLGRWKRIELTSERRLVSATLDPEDRLVIDVNRLNNSRRVELDGRAAVNALVERLRPLPAAPEPPQPAVEPEPPSPA